MKKPLNQLQDSKLLNRCLGKPGKDFCFWQVRDTFTGWRYIATNEFAI